MTQTAFDPSYTAVTKDGAEWIVKRGDIRLVGVDYISVAHYKDLKGPHVALLTAVSSSSSPRQLKCSASYPMPSIFFWLGLSL